MVVTVEHLGSKDMFLGRGIELAVLGFPLDKQLVDLSRDILQKMIARRKFKVAVRGDDR